MRTVYRQNVDLSRQFAYLLVVRTEVVVAVEFGEFDAVAIVFRVGASPGQVRVKLRREHFDAFRRQTLHAAENSHGTAPERFSAVFILGICRGDIPPKVLYSPKEPSKFLHRTLDTAKSPLKVSDSPPPNYR